MFDPSTAYQPGFRAKDGDLAAQLQLALNKTPAGDQRSVLGQTRGGRQLAQRVIDAILADSDVLAP